MAAGSLEPNQAVRVSWETDSFAIEGATIGVVNPAGTGFIRGLLDVPGGVPIPKIGIEFDARPVGASTSPIAVNGSGYPEVDNTTFSGTATAHIADLEFETVELIRARITTEIPTSVVNSSASVLGQDIIHGSNLRVNFVNQTSTGNYNLGWNNNGSFNVTSLVTGGSSDYFDGREFYFSHEILAREVSAPALRTQIDSIDPDDSPVNLGTFWNVASEGDYTASPVASTGIYINDAATSGAGTLFWTHLRARAADLNFL